jgi:hypothetical protein
MESKSWSPAFATFYERTNTISAKFELGLPLNSVDYAELEAAAREMAVNDR